MDEEINSHFSIYRSQVRIRCGFADELFEHPWNVRAAPIVAVV